MHREQGDAMIDGTDQAHRSAPALAPGYVLVDELGFEQRVRISEQLASRLAFVDLQGRVQGNWQALVRADELLLLASLAAGEASQPSLQPAGSGNEAALARMADDLLRQALQMDRWLRDLRGVDARHLMECGDGDGTGCGAARQVAQAIEKRIADPLAAELAAVIEDFGLQHAWDPLLPLWRPSSPPSAHRQGGVSAPGRSASLVHACRHSFAAAQRQVQQLARELLPRSASSGQHEPAAALLAAFLQLYQRVQQRINRFTDRHTDFYYIDCLRFQPRPGVADRLHLTVARDPRIAQDVRLAAGAVFAAGKDTEGRPIEYRAEQALDVTDARVAALRCLTVEHDPLMSPERELAHVTRVLARSIEPSDGPQAAEQPWWPLFGGDAPDAEMGLAVASPMLWLGEGEREICLRLGLAGDPRRDVLEVRRLLRELRHQRTQESFCRRLGLLFCRWLLAADETLDERARQRLHAVAARWLPGLQDTEHDPASPLALLAGQPVERELVFHQLFEGAFAISLSTPDGWLRLDDTHIARAPVGSGHALALTLRLRPQDPPVTACVPQVHGACGTHGLPMIRLQLIRDSRQCPYTLLTSRDFTELHIEVSVKGLRDVTLANQLGRLDPARPFQPFGPLPDVGSYLVIGARELACKPLEALDIRLLWNGLPSGDGGFAAHYADYPQRITNNSFTVDLSLLRGGLWQQPEDALRDPRLFATQQGSTRLATSQCLRLEPSVLRRLFHPEPCSPSEADFHYNLRSRNGFLRLRLATPEGAFGHQEHPLVLTRVVTANARHRHRRAQALPRTPYTPLLERIALDYRAGCTVRLGAADGEHRIYHLHPFGVERIDVPQAGRRTILPRYPSGGHLLIGLEAAQPGGLLTLLFHLREDAAAARLSHRGPLEWACLCGDQWIPLAPARLLSDTTEGLLTSGIVAIDLPTDMNREHSVMPSGLYWLRVSAAGGFESFAGLYEVLAQALTLVRCPSPAEADIDADGALPPRQVTGPVGSVAGLASVLQVGPSFGLRRREDPAQLRVRAGERLRHRQRASTAWDVERLVLEEFPSVFKLKCFANLRSDRQGASPGHVLVALVPSALPGCTLQTPRLNAGELQRIADFLARHASPFARFEVRNAAYERVQVRCRVHLTRGAHTGRCLRRIEQALVDYLSPWSEVGRPAVFGWSLRCEDVQSFIRSLPEVDSVGGVSLLQVAESDAGQCTLADTARPRAAVPRSEATLLRGCVPWSIAVPMAQHLVELHDDAHPIQPEPSGVSHLGIGSTFIVGEA